MNKIARLAWLAALAAIGVWLYLVLFPSPEKVIRKNLDHLARTASFSSKEGVLVRLAHAQNFADFFSTNVEMELNIPGHGTRRLMDRDDILQAAIAARSQLDSLVVQFPNIAIDLSPDKQTASVELTLQARVSGESDVVLQELNFTFQKADGKWLITRVKTVRIFS